MGFWKGVGESCRIIYNIYMFAIFTLFYTEGDLNVAVLWFFFLLFLL